MADPLKAQGIIVDGPCRLFRNKEFQARVERQEVEIRQRYAEALAQAKGFWERRAIERKIQTEIAKLKPSSYSLW